MFSLRQNRNLIPGAQVPRCGLMRPSASLRTLDVAGGDLVFVGGKGGQDFGLLTLRHF